MLFRVHLNFSSGDSFEDVRQLELAHINAGVGMCPRKALIWRALLRHASAGAGAQKCWGLERSCLDKTTGRDQCVAPVDIVQRALLNLSFIRHP
eukprot:1161318-Pelagomonas_calceolata.AAC.2